MVFEAIIAAVTTVLAALVIVYLFLYFYFWKFHPCCDFNVLKTPYFTLIGIALFAISNILLVLHVFEPATSHIASLLLSGFGLLLIFLAFYWKVKRNAYEHLQHSKKKKSRA